MRLTHFAIKIERSRRNWRFLEGNISNWNVHSTLKKQFSESDFQIGLRVPLETSISGKRFQIWDAWSGKRVVFPESDNFSPDHFTSFMAIAFSAAAHVGFPLDSWPAWGPSGAIAPTFGPLFEACFRDAVLTASPRATN